MVGRLAAGGEPEAVPAVGHAAGRHARGAVRLFPRRGPVDGDGNLIDGAALPIFPRMSSVPRVLGALVASLLVFGAGLSGCSRGGTVPTADVVVHLKDFEIDLSDEHVPQGDLVFGLENSGPTVHELVVARTDLPADELPLGEDGLSVDEDTPDIRVLGEDEHVKLTEQGLLELALESGHYVVFCNLEGHYLGGMHRDLEVTS